MEQLFVSVREACNVTGLGRSKMYRMFDDGQVETVKIGTRRLVRIASLRAWTSNRRKLNRHNSPQAIAKK